MKKTHITIMILILALTLVTLVNAELRLTLLTPQAAFYKTVGDNANYFVSVENKNPFNVQIDLTPSSDLNIQFDGPTSFMLEPNNTKTINYIIAISKSGNYSSAIAVKYTSLEDNSTFALSQTLIFSVVEKQTEQQPVENSNSNSGSSYSGSGGSSTVPAKKNITTTNYTNTTTASVVADNTCSGDVCALNTTVIQDSDISVVENKNFIQKYWIYILIVFIVVAIVLILFLNNRKEKSSKTIEAVNVDKGINEFDNQVIERR